MLWFTWTLAHRSPVVTSVWLRQYACFLIFNYWLGHGIWVIPFLNWSSLVVGRFGMCPEPASDWEIGMQRRQHLLALWTFSHLTLLIMQPWGWLFSSKCIGSALLSIWSLRFSLKKRKSGFLHGEKVWKKCFFRVFFVEALNVIPRTLSLSFPNLP